MRGQKRRNARMVILFFIGSGLLNYPLLSLFSSEEDTILGIPLLYAVVYIIWFMIIGFAVLTIGFRKDDSPSHSD